jgi:transcriptional regulator NrdR family protein
MIMSSFNCSCGQKTSVIDTRDTNDRLKRRRKCPNDHRFNTVEVPLEARDKLIDIIVWSAQRSTIDGDLNSFVGEQVDHILLGKPLPYPPDQPPNTADP